MYKKLQKLLKKGKVMVRGVRLRDAVSLFNAIDNDYSGTLCKQEIREVLKGLHLGVDEQAILHWMRDLDEDGSGAVDAEEFLEKIMQRKPTELELKNVKGGAHMNSNGTVRKDNLKKGKGTGTKAQNESITKQILLSLESSCKRSIFGQYVSTQLLTWTEKGKSKLDTFLAKMGISKKECSQPYNFMSTSGKSKLRTKISQFKNEHDLDNLLYRSFTSQSIDIFNIFDMERSSKKF